MQRAPQDLPRQSLLPMWSSSRATMAPPPPGHMGQTSSFESSEAYRPSVPATSILLPLTGSAQPPRGISMHDAAYDVQQSTYPYFPQPQRDKGKSRLSTLPPSQAGTSAERGFEFRSGLGYVCLVCGRLCAMPALHTTVDGRCVGVENEDVGSRGKLMSLHKVGGGFSGEGSTMPEVGGTIGGMAGEETDIAQMSLLQSNEWQTGQDMGSGSGGLFF